MGLIRAAAAAVGGTVSDQWREYFYCESLSADTLAAKGQKRVSGRSSNTKGGDNIISNGSVIAVADGQCMMIVEQGKVVEVCAEPGEFKWDSSTEPSIFCGKLGKSILNTFKTIGRRFTFGGDTAKDQRVYYFNTKEIVENKYGTANPVPFRVVDRNIGLDIDISVRCNGLYSYKIVDPLLFYTNVCGNFADTYERSEIDGMLKAELLTALQPAFAKLSEMGIRYSALPGHTMEIADALNEVLSSKWADLRGLRVASFAINSVTASKEDEELIKQAQRTAMLRDPGMAGATLVGAQAEAMKAAAANEGGAMLGFMGMNAAVSAGGAGAQNFFEMSRQQAAQQQAQRPAADEWSCSCGAKNTGKFCAECGAPRPAPVSGEGSWVCSCGTKNSGKFCLECGSPRPASDEWVCSCGNRTKGRFCPECGSPRPSAVKRRCGKCGWEPEDQAHPPKFCPECGDVFDDNDII
ncbi:MAG: SPFH domain-containing protein [Eubacteriales bacterium]